MQLVVPMAGLGQRFSSAGYETPKPLIPVDGVPMVVRAVWDYPPTDRRVFVVHAEHLRQFQIDDVLRHYFPDCRIVTTPVVTQGQACTVRLAGTELDPDDSVLVAACDNSHLYDEQEFERLTSEERYDCLIWTYRHDSRVLRRPEAHGWVRTRGETREAEFVSCKQPVSPTPMEDHAVSGCFWFRSARQMLAAIDAQVAAADRVGHEFYLDVTPNVLLRQGARVGVFEVEKYIGWGTPDDLEDYERWGRYFASRGCEMVRS
ncbi:MAG: NTP transferase domain-containing protein [Pirellulales bacterium]